MSAETIELAAADADAAPLDPLLTDAALGVLKRVNPGGSGLRLAAASAAAGRGDLPRVLVAGPCGLAGERSGEEKSAPAELGGGGRAPVCDAPGTYVYDR